MSKIRISRSSSGSISTTSERYCFEGKTIWLTLLTHSWPLSACEHIDDIVVLSIAVPEGETRSASDEVR